MQSFGLASCVSDPPAARANSARSPLRPADVAYTLWPSALTARPTTALLPRPVSVPHASAPAFSWMQSLGMDSWVSEPSEFRVNSAIVPGASWSPTYTLSPSGLTAPASGPANQVPVLEHSVLLTLGWAMQS